MCSSRQWEAHLRNSWASRGQTGHGPWGMGGAEQVGVSSCRAGRETGEASGQEVGKCPTSMPPVVIADGLESQGAGRVYRSITRFSPQLLGGTGLAAVVPTCISVGRTCRSEAVPV